MAVAMSRNFSSSTKSCRPSAARMARACSRWGGDASGVAVHTVIPSPTCAGVFGMLRTMARCPRPVEMEAMVAPATMDTTSAPGSTAPRSSPSTAGSTCGFTASTTTCARRAAARLSSDVRTWNWPPTASSRSRFRSLATMPSACTSRRASRPPIMADAIAPAPMNATFRSPSTFFVTPAPR